VTSDDSSVREARSLLNRLYSTVNAAIIVVEQQRMQYVGYGAECRHDFVNALTSRFCVRRRSDVK